MAGGARPSRRPSGIASRPATALTARRSHARPLTTGRGESNFRTATGLLVSIATYLREEPHDRNLALKVLSKAEERARTEDDIVGLHCVYQEMIRLHTKWRDHCLDGLDLIFGACHKQVALSTLAAAALRELRPEAPLPTHLGFQVMAKLLEQEGSYTKALEMCKEARDQGWAGNWTWKIGCLAKQRQAQKSDVTYISRSGITPI